MLVLEGVAATTSTGRIGLILAGVAVAAGFLCRILMSAGALSAATMALYGVTLGYADMMPFGMPPDACCSHCRVRAVILSIRL